MREIGDIVQAVERSPHERFALATLVRTRGSSYRRPGARMLIAGDGSAVGSLSGGCLEQEVVDRAREVIRTGEPAWMQFDTRRRFGCHGEIEIFVERACPAFLAEVSRCFHARRSFIVETAFSRDAATAGSRMTTAELGCPSPETFVQKIVPPVQLLVIGDGPDSAALRGFAHTLGWPVIAVESATELGESYDEWTAAVVKTHNYGRDFAALRALLPLGLRYVGLLGPRRRREQLLGDLLDTGLDVGQDLFGPAGLDLGGDSPEAIALAIIAEIQSVFASGSRQALRERRAPIHGFSKSDLAVAD
jgi:xanthine/CO dehydrogenase XdhC/CoxF family maturation factor